MADEAGNIIASLNCPVPAGPGSVIHLAHGGGGRWMQRLLEQVFLPAFSNPALNNRHDGGVVTINGSRLAFTTDTYVVRPLFFPGGDIGTLAVNGTVNDLAMCGARPLYLSAGFILEEGLDIETLRKVVDSMKDAAARAGITVVTGDTKVVDRGKGDSIFINTAGIGLIETSLQIRPQSVQPGDAVIVSSDLGRHGIAVLSVREGLEFEGEVASDCAPLWEPVEALLQAGVEVHCLRDLTRGGLSSALNEIAASSGAGIQIVEQEIPVSESIRGACEILGLDPMYVANEGRFVAFVPGAQAAETIAILRRFEVSSQASIAGEVNDRHPGLVSLETALGAHRVLEMLSGEQLPRIC